MSFTYMGNKSEPDTLSQITSLVIDHGVVGHCILQYRSVKNEANHEYSRLLIL